jgi:hypothetical protein
LRGGVSRFQEPHLLRGLGEGRDGAVGNAAFEARDGLDEGGGDEGDGAEGALGAEAYVYF